MTKLHFRLWPAMGATIAVAIFLVGYQLGHERTDQEPTDVVNGTAQPSQWEQLGETSTIEPLGGMISVLTPDGCQTYPIDANGNPLGDSDANPIGSDDQPESDGGLEQAIHDQSSL